MNQAQALVLKATDSNATLAEQHEAFCELVRIFQDMAYACAYAVLGDFYLAEDAAQEAFISAWQKISQLRQPEAFPGWFRRIVLTECNHLTRGKRLPTISLDEGLNLHATHTDPQTAIERGELTKAVFMVIKKLPVNERMVVLLFYVKEHSQGDISAFLEVPLTTVAKRLYSARVRLRGMMMDGFKNDLTAHRPSRNEEFARRVMALLNAAAVGDASEVERLLVRSQGQAPKLVNASGPHPYWGGEPNALHVAAEWGHAEVVELLLKQGADPNVRGAEYDHWSPLHLAIHRDHGPAAHNRAIELLIAHGAEVDIWAAAALGDAEHVRKLLAGDSSLVRAKGPNHATPLHFAATVEVAQLLVAAGAGLKAKDKYGRSPMQAVAGYGQRRRAAALYLSEQTGELDIFIACAIGEAQAVASFLAQPELIHAHSEVGWPGETPLNVAARHGQTEVVRTLLRLGAGANLKAPSGCFPLHLAARNGHIETARLLLEHGADLNAREDQHQSTPLGWAEFQGQQEMDRFLRQRGGILD